MTNIAERNYNTISPSAKALLLMKGYTSIPFAKQAAALAVYPEKYSHDFTKKDITFWGRTYHFENRYWSIDQLMEGLQIKNILELSSGFSFRGLEAVKQKGIHYIDTDLPDLIATKKEFVNTFKNEGAKTEGILEVLPLNALDEQQFRDVVSRFPAGEIVIVNEGLLMYLDTNEKEKLCRMIHDILKERGGYWITADVYVKTATRKLNLKLNDELQSFLEKHKVEENKFEDYAQAETFFKQQGFVVDKEAKVSPGRLTSLTYLLKSINIWTRLKFIFRKRVKIQATWRLKVAG